MEKLECTAKAFVSPVRLRRILLRLEDEPRPCAIVVRRPDKASREIVIYTLSEHKQYFQDLIDSIQ